MLVYIYALVTTTLPFDHARVTITVLLGTCTMACDQAVVVQLVFLEQGCSQSGDSCRHRLRPRLQLVDVLVMLQRLPSDEIYAIGCGSHDAVTVSDCVQTRL